MLIYEDINIYLETMSDKGIEIGISVDSKIGLKKLKVLHLTDSLKPFGSKKDRHANIGKGLIGTETLKRIVHHFKLKNVVKLLETPYINGKAPYKEEIELLK